MERAIVGDGAIVLDPMLARLKKRVLDGIFSPAYLQPQVYGWAAAVLLGKPNARALVTRAQFDMPHDGVACLAFIFRDDHERQCLLLALYSMKTFAGLGGYICVGWFCSTGQGRACPRNLQAIALPISLSTRGD